MVSGATNYNRCIVVIASGVVAVSGVVGVSGVVAVS